MKALLRIGWITVFFSLGVGLAILIAQHAAPDAAAVSSSPPLAKVPFDYLASLAGIASGPKEQNPEEVTGRDEQPASRDSRSATAPLAPSSPDEGSSRSVVDRPRVQPAIGPSTLADKQTGVVNALASLETAEPSAMGEQTMLLSELEEASAPTLGMSEATDNPEHTTVGRGETTQDTSVAEDGDDITEVGPLSVAPLPPEPAGAASGAAVGPPVNTRSAPANASASADAASASVGSEENGLLMVRFRETDLREALEALSQEGSLNIIAGQSVSGKITATLSNVTVEEALQAVLDATGYTARQRGPFLFVGTPTELRELEQSGQETVTRVFRPSYVPAQDLEKLVTPLLSDAGVVSVSSPAEVGIGPDSTNAGGDAFAGSDVLVVRDYPSVLDQVEEVVRTVDRRPPQVAIEAMILSVKVDDQEKFGVSFELLRNAGHIRFGWGDLTPMGDGVDAVKYDGSGLKLAYLDGSVATFVQALEKLGDTNIVASPHLMVLNKHRAEILIGQELGYLTTTVTENAATQTVEFLEVGTRLILRPFVSSEGIVRMEVHPELSSGSIREAGGQSVPDKATTQVTSNIMVPDGRTVVIGGLIDENLQTTGSQIPVLGNLPLVGAAFRNRTETIQRQEIIVLITPRIVQDYQTAAEGERAACEFQRRQQVYFDKTNPLGKRHMASNFVRKARASLAAGNLRAALRQAELAVQFDPVSREAIRLRAQIWQRMHSTGTALPEGWSQPMELPPLEIEGNEGLPPVPGSQSPQMYEPKRSLDGSRVAPELLETLQE